ncbi:hypothetical protein VB711_07935 [Cronbergia sp. UHCC 0137]|uniref:tetratricopeptide repeat protein n=1 Tax=Cronbergia sp. UHCC 0137 TaxID=3110239 RepID=UPI002B1EFBD1|nr:hypothetical protein [Cronbergia sp. UHCC 0137]MEA5617767.1 hypothetical protein [Cronbergia sp. UHCC 0137]
MFRYLSFIATTFIFWNLWSTLTLAQGKKLEELDKFPPSPLEIITSDPLLPLGGDKRELTAEERQNLSKVLDELNQEALVKLQGGDKVAAFEIWNRELRLRRFLGTFAEIEALSRVGTIAVRENEGQQVQYITQRVKAIEKQLVEQKSTDLDLWRSLGVAYQSLRLPKLAVEVYQQVLTLVRQQQDSTAELATLNTIGELHLSWFNYPPAATTYRELLNLAINKRDRVNEVVYLRRLAEIYTRTKEYQQVIEVLVKLANIYTAENDLTQIPALKIAIATNYESLAQKNPNLIQEAFNNYQEAYITAWELEQHTRASEALQKLIALYRSRQQTNEALQASKILIETEKLATNFYGLMQAYDQMAQLYLQRQEYPQALTAFQEGLKLAIQLKHQEIYFIEQIEKL